MRRNKRSSLKMEQTLQQTKKEMKNLGAGGGSSSTTEDTKSGTSRKQFSTAKGSKKIGKKFKNSLQTLLLYSKLWGNLDVEKNSKTKQAEPPPCGFLSLSLSLSLSLTLSLAQQLCASFLPRTFLRETKAQQSSSKPHNSPSSIQLFIQAQQSSSNSYNSPSSKCSPSKSFTLLILLSSLSFCLSV